MIVANANVCLPLELLAAGERGTILELDGPASAVHRLQELGLRIGESIRMLRPGSPALVQLGETRLCLRPETDVSVLIACD